MPDLAASTTDSSSSPFSSSDGSIPNDKKNSDTDTDPMTMLQSDEDTDDELNTYDARASKSNTNQPGGEQFYDEEQQQEKQKEQKEEVVKEGLITAAKIALVVAL